MILITFQISNQTNKIYMRRIQKLTVSDGILFKNCFTICLVSPKFEYVFEAAIALL